MWSAEKVQERWLYHKIKKCTWLHLLFIIAVDLFIRNSFSTKTLWWEQQMILGSVYGHHGHALCALELLVLPVVHRLRCPCTNCTLYCTTAAMFINTTVELHVYIFLCVPPNTNPLQWATHHSKLPWFAQYLILYFCFTRFYQNIFYFQHLFLKFPSGVFFAPGSVSSCTSKLVSRQSVESGRNCSLQL